NYRPILDLRVLNKALMPLRFRMLTPRRLVQFIRPNDLFITIDLKDAYFHIPIQHRHRRYLRFAFGGIAYQFKAPIRPVPSAEGIYKERRGSRRPTTSTRLTRLHLFGRLVNCFSFKGCSSAGRPSSGGAPASTGLCNTQGKEGSLPQASYAFSKYDFKLYLHEGQA